MASRAKKESASNLEQANQLLILDFDMLDPRLTVLHRAGLAGLLIQIEAMKKLTERATEDDKARYEVPDPEIQDGGRKVKFTFSEQTFHNLLRERYLAITVKSEKAKSKGRKDKKSAGQESETASEERTLPRLQYFEAFGAKEAWQNHTRSAYFDSFFCIYQQRVKYFKTYQPADSLGFAVDLWRACVSSKTLSVGKSLFPNTTSKDFKGRDLEDDAKRALLLHFWPIASAFFTPKVIRIEKNDQTKETEIHYDYQQPVIVVPDVIDIERFRREHIRYLKDLPAPEVTAKGKEYLAGAYISTPHEATLSFFFVPQMAHRTLVTHDTRGARGAEVYVYKRPYKKGKPDKTRQADVSAISKEPLDEEILEKYRLLQDLRSPVYRALRVENLLAARVWHDGFDKLTDLYPLELFVATKRKQSGRWELNEKAGELATDLAADFAIYAGKENRMDNDETKIPTLIDDVVNRYLDWCVFNKGQSPPDEKKVKEIFRKKREQIGLSPQEQEMLDKYNQARMKMIERAFIDFRGVTDQRSFAELFVTCLFEACFHTTPEQRAMLQPYYEGEKWESGRWLTLMAVSAAGAPPRRKFTSDPQNSGIQNG
jgi:CRISPR-associated protein Cmx8